MLSLYSIKFTRICFRKKVELNVSTALLYMEMYALDNSYDDSY